MSVYNHQREWSDRFIPHIKEIVGPQLLETASTFEDVHHVTDFCVLGMESKRVACRVRQACYADRYPYDVTLRTSAKGDHTETEFQKVVKGWGDIMFYGFQSPDDADRIGRWVLGDMHALRQHLYQQAASGVALQHRENYDGTTFVVINYRDVQDFVVASSHTVPVTPLELLKAI